VVFSFAFHQVLRALAEDLDTEDLRPTVPTASIVDGEFHQGEDTKLPIPAVFDDLVLVVTAPSPQELVQKCARVLAKTGKAFASRGMEVNDSRGKTEALLEFYGTGAAKVKHDTLQGNQQIHVDHLLFGERDIGITHQYKHLGSINAGPRKYDQEVESRSAQAKATTKALRRNMFAEKALPRTQRLTAWRALVQSKLIFHAATWGTMTVDNWKKIDTAYHQGLRCIHGETKYTQLKYGTQTKLGVRQDLRAPDIRQVVSTRRLGLLKRVLDSNSEWMLGLIVEQWDSPRGWAREVRSDLETWRNLRWESLQHQCN
jgi:hypothetical protein